MVSICLILNPVLIFDIALDVDFFGAPSIEELAMAVIQPLTHNLEPHFGELRLANNSKELKALPLYKTLEKDISSVMESYEMGEFAPKADEKPVYRAVTWNVERGIHFDQVCETLKTHEALKDADILMIPETDLGMARTKNLNVAYELAKELKYNYYFVPCYMNLTKGNGAEMDFEGDNTLALHGNAILSRYPIKDFHIIPLHNNKDKMKGNEKRIGHQQALACTVELPQRDIRMVGAHLDAHSSKRHRKDQMLRILHYIDHLYELPTLFGGDLNTTTYNSRHASTAIFGFCVRVMMGVKRVIDKHYPYPDRFFEKRLFKSFEKHGFDYKNWNEAGVCTHHYDFSDEGQFKNLRDLVPNWCFKCVEWALRDHDGKCSFKIDWFAAKNLTPSHPKVIGDIRHNGKRISDHDAIIVDFQL